MVTMEMRGIGFVTLIFGLFCIGIFAAKEPQCDPSWQNYNLHSEGYYHHRKDNHDKKSNTDTLKLVHVVFRHGDRAADDETLYPKDPYLNFTYFPFGYGQLTNVGKRQEYDIGKHLRERYNDYLGANYFPEILDAVSTNFNRTKMSLSLVLAGLYPPSKDQTWNKDLPWLPIPYNYLPDNEDRLLGDPLKTCPKYKKLYMKNELTESNLIENGKLKTFYQYVNYHTGLNTSKPMNIYDLYFLLRAEEGFGLLLPPWTECVWPDKLLSVALKQYKLFTQTPQLMGLSAGVLVQKILLDSFAKINGTLSPEGRKIYLYSAHERNVALTLIALGLYYPHMPPYASYVLLELHEIDGFYGFKVFYQDYKQKNPKLMVIPGCEKFCRIDKFYSLIEKNLPKESCDI